MVGNRIAGESDRKLYGEYITVGDLIIDTPTKDKDGIREVVYYFMDSKLWPTLRENATIWIDGDKLGDVNFIRFNNSAKEQTPWHISNVTIKNIPNTQVVCGGLLCYGVKNLCIDGESNIFPGLNNWNSNRKFTSGYFGFHIKNKNTHGIYASVLDGGTIKIKGVEVQYGFSGIRLLAGKDNITVEEIDISNFYIHDIVRGEGFYIGSTQSGDKPKIKNLKIRNGFITRTAAEAIQVQHLIGGSIIENIVIYAADTNWLNGFQANQDTGIQWVNSSGINIIKNLIIDGFAAQGLSPYGSEINIDIAKEGHGYVENVLFNEGRNILSYIHKSASNGYNWHYKNIFLRSFNNTYAEAGIEKKSYYISRHWGSDPITYESIIHDGSKDKIFENEKNFIIGEITLDETLPSPDYLNTGFGKNSSSKIKIWHPVYGKYFTGNDNTPTKWSVNDIAIEIIDNEIIDYKFYLCIKDHETLLPNYLRPSESPNFKLLKWDENGVRCDHSDWQSTLKQSFFPPDDLRLTDNCFWRKKGIGIVVTEDSEKEKILEEYILYNIRYTITNKGTYLQPLLKK